MPPRAEKFTLKQTSKDGKRITQRENKKKNKKKVPHASPAAHALNLWLPKVPLVPIGRATSTAFYDAMVEMEMEMEMDGHNRDGWYVLNA